MSSEIIHKKSSKKDKTTMNRSSSTEMEQSSYNKKEKESELKSKKRKHRSPSKERNKYSDQENLSNSKKKKYYDDDDNWNHYNVSHSRSHHVGSRYYDQYRYDNSSDNYNNKKKYSDENKKDNFKKNNNDEEKEKTLKKNDKNNEQTIEKRVRNENKLMDITTKSGGAYIPPAKLKMMQAQITDKASTAYQRIAWEALKKSIHGHINKVNTTNIDIIVRELFKENIVRGRGLLCRSIIQAQAASPTFTHVYAALVAVINCKFPNIGELLLKRLILQFRRGFKRNDKSICISATSFIAHLVNQNVTHEIIALEVLALLLDTPTNDSVEVAISFLKECGMKLTQVSKKGLEAIFDMLRNILHEGQLDKRVKYMIDIIFQIRKDNFQAHEAVISELDKVKEEDQITHLLSLTEIKDGEDILNVFKFDSEYEENEKKYSTLRKEILDESSDESGSEGDDEDGTDSSDEEEGPENEEKSKDIIIDETETNLVALRRTIYLTIQSSVDFQECAHKLLRMELKPGQESELCHMLLDSCAELRTYEKFYGLLAQRFCLINKIFVGPFENIFGLTYSTIHRLDTNKLRNVAKFFAHLLFTDAISWNVLEKIHLNEDETTSSGRIFIKILFQELSEYMGLTKLNERVKDPTMQSAFDGLFPRDNPKNTRFAINFFTSIGLGGLTDDLREHLKALPKVPIITKLTEDLSTSSSDSSTSDSSLSSSSSSSSSSDSSSSSSSSVSSSDSESDACKRKKKKKMMNKSNKKEKHTKSIIKKDKSKNKKKEKTKEEKDSKHNKKNKLIEKKKNKKDHNKTNDESDDDDVEEMYQNKKRREENVEKKMNKRDEEKNEKHFRRMKNNHKIKNNENVTISDVEIVDDDNGNSGNEKDKRRRRYFNESTIYENEKGRKGRYDHEKRHQERRRYDHHYEDQSNRERIKQRERNEDYEKNKEPERRKDSDKNTERNIISGNSNSKYDKSRYNRESDRRKESNNKYSSRDRDRGYNLERNKRK